MSETNVYLGIKSLHQFFLRGTVALLTVIPQVIITMVYGVCFIRETME